MYYILYKRNGCIKLFANLSTIRLLIRRWLVFFKEYFTEKLQYTLIKLMKCFISKIASRRPALI